MSQKQRVVKQSDIEKLALKGLPAQQVADTLGISLPRVYMYAPEGCYKKFVKVQRTKIIKDGTNRSNTQQIQKSSHHKDKTQPAKSVKSRDITLADVADHVREDSVAEKQKYANYSKLVKQESAISGK